MTIIVYNRFVTLLLLYHITLGLYLSSELLDVRENTRLVVLVVRPKQTEIANSQGSKLHIAQVTQHLSTSLRPKGMVSLLGQQKPTALIVLGQGVMAHPSTMFDIDGFAVMTFGKQVHDNQSRVSLESLIRIVPIPRSAKVESSGQVQDSRIWGRYQLGGMEISTALRKVNLVPGTTETKRPT